MSEDMPSVQTTVSTCPQCGTRTTASYHDGRRCDGLVIEVDGTLQCAECGVQITPRSTCPACGATTTTETTNSPVSLRQEIPSTQIAEAIRTQIQRGYSKSLTHDETLSAIASRYVSVTVEQTHFSSSASLPTLSDRVDQHSLPLGGYQTYSLESYPDGETAKAIASEVYTEFLSAFPDSDTEFTHLGIGVHWNPRGSLHAGVIATKRLVTVPGDIKPSNLEKAIHSATNEQRAAHGYSRLAYETHLAGIARTHSRTMATQGFFAHESPDGSTTMDRYRRANYHGQQAGENISKQYSASTTDAEAIATDVVDGWMDSPGHRENILTSSFDVEGIGLYQGDDGALFVTQNFG
jgi:uncharacterized protein YkwD/RNA polymerase subunit RPABC4/transcription elongation factor Spt4